MKRVVSFEFTQLVTTITFSQFEINHMIKWSTCANQTKCRSPRPTIPILARYLELASKGVAVDSMQQSLYCYKYLEGENYVWRKSRNPFCYVARSNKRDYTLDTAALNKRTTVIITFSYPRIASTNSAVSCTIKLGVSLRVLFCVLDKGSIHFVNS